MTRTVVAVASDSENLEACDPTPSAAVGPVDGAPVEPAPAGEEPAGLRNFFSPRPPAWLPRAVATTLLLIGAGVVAWNVFFSLTQLWMMLLIALFVSFALEPAVAGLARRGMRRGVATVLVGSGVFIALAAVFVAVGAVVVQQGADFAGDLPDLIADASQWASDTFGVDVDSTRLLREGGPVDTVSSNAAAKFSEGIVSLSVWLLAFVAQLLTVMLFSFYLSADGPRIRRAFVRMFPMARQEQVLLVMTLGIEKTGGFLWSRLVLALVSTVAHAAAFVAIGVPYPLPMALWVGLFSQAIPVFGTYIAAAAPLLVAAGDSTSTLLLAALFVVLYQQLENTVLAPRVTGAAVSVHPMFAFAAVVAGTIVAGVPGAVLAIPAAATVQGFMSSVWQLHDIADEDHVLLQTDKT